ncbi:universal stress protein, partial [bacterium]|nr:universal stress protein [bacterium]
MNILVPLDGSELSESALICAQQIAEERQAEVFLLHVTPHYASLAPAMPPAMVLELQERDQVRAADYLAAAQQRFPPNRVHPLAPMGRPVEEIAQVAGREKCDLIIMNSHGREGMARWLLGSVAEGVLRSSPCPLLLLRPKTLPTGRYQHILVPVDGSAASLQVVHKIEPFVAPGGKVTLLQCSQVAANPGNFRMGMEEAERYMARKEEDLRKVRVEGLQVEAHLLQGEPAEVILNWSQANGCDLIAMSTHGRSGFRL